ncbi:hypothetical protein F4775DRAFT_119142 [Biscogniauxia sp. FL1348]|nr:hypothetical protein F4775DRAFT_119142 [Biscogniauxia sp. FL1348]
MNLHIKHSLHFPRRSRVISVLITMGKHPLYYTPLLWLASQAVASRECGGSTTESLTYLWRVGDARYDGADLGQNNEQATLAISIMPGNSTYATFFECVAEWPEPWAGWYEDGSIIWSDCIWAGNGPTYDTTVSFAVDWKTREMSISHTFDCSDKQGSAALATGSIHLDMNCAVADGPTSCTLQSDDAATSPSFNTTSSPPPLEAGSACTDNSDRYQSWQLENWQRQYELVPGSSASSPSGTSDTGPSFTLRNMANSDVFKCSASEDGSGNTFDGTCTSGAEGDATNTTTTTTATFLFDSQLDILKVTQTWNCSDSTPFDAIGVGYVQATCSREGNMLTCTSDPLWIGTTTI